ncbi:7474_t:CDS:2 [Funneliformis geosporum]|uniref:7474_t:CDS:1 n=1 Tax=Funneliformis geosporum TaxID=1117311 RepID=A0A9W4SYB4_9GLOM|nr:7474_t:CDS:2 [Funneliformis geosporum]
MDGKDISDDKGSLEYLPIYSFLFSNIKGSSLYNAYDQDEVENKLVIKIDQDNRASKFSVADDVSEVYGLPGIHECINGQKPLRAVIDIDATYDDMKANGVNWENILKGLVITTSSVLSKCSYHILYVSALLIDHHELKAFTELFSKKGCVKRILQFSLDNNWNKLKHARVQPPTSLGLEVRPRILSVKKNNNPLPKEETKENFIYFNRKASLECPLCKGLHDKDQRWFSRVCVSSGKFIIKCFRQNSDELGEIFECDPSIAEKIRQENKKFLQSFHKVKVLDFTKAFLKFPSWVKYNDLFTATEMYEERYVRPLPNKGDIYVGSPWETGKTYILEYLTISDDVNLLVLFTRHFYSNAVTTRLNLKSYCNINVSIITQAQSRLAGQSIEKLYKLIQEARRIIVMDNDLTDLNIEWIKILQTVLAELWDWAKQMISLSFEKRKSALLICHLRKDVQGIVRALKTDFSELRIKEYYGESDPEEKARDFSNVEESWKDLNLIAYTSTLKIGVLCTNPKDIDSIIWNKDVPTIQLWVAFILEKFCFQRLFGWRMIDFLKEAGMIISIIEPILKSDKNVVSLSQTVEVNSSIVKAKEISDIANANILDRETAEFLENKPKKTLKEIRSLDRHHIADCYEISPELLTEDFISKYGNYKHMRWFRAYRQI